MASSKKSRSSKKRGTVRRIKVRRNTQRPIVIIVKSPPTNEKKKKRSIGKTAAIIGAGAGALTLISPVIAGYSVSRSVKRYEKRKQQHYPPRRKRLMPYQSITNKNPTEYNIKKSYRDIHGYRNR